MPKRQPFQKPEKPKAHADIEFGDDKKPAPSEEKKQMLRDAQRKLHKRV